MATNYFADKFGPPAKKEEENYFASKYGAAPIAPKLTVDNSPLNIAPQKRRSFIKGEPVESIDNRQDVTLGREGIQVDRPGDGPLSLEDYQNISYYSAGPQYARNFIGKKVLAKYPQAADYSISDLTRVVDGKVQYLDFSKEKPRWTVVNDSMLYSFGKPAMWGEAVADTAFGAAGAMGGGLLGPASAAAGAAGASGVVSGIAREMALKKGRELGINEGLDDEDIRRLAISTGMITGGTAGLLGGIGSWDRSSLQNSLIPKTTARGIGDDFAKNSRAAGEVVDSVNDAGRKLGLDEQFDPTPAQRSGIKELKDVEATLEAGHAGKATQEIAVDIRNRKSRDQRVLTQIWEGLFPKSKNSIATVEDTGLGIRALAYEKAGQAPEAALLRQADAGKTAIRKELETIDDTLNYDEVISSIRGMESPDGRIAGTKFYDLRDRLVAKQEALTREVAERGANATVEISEKNLLLPRLVQLRAQLGQGLPSLSAAMGDTKIASQLDELIQVVMQNEGKVPFNLVDKIHQDFGTLIAKVQSSPAAGIDAPSVAHLSNIAATLEEAITTSTKTGPVYARDVVETWVDRKAATTLRHEVFDRKAVRQALASEEMDGPTGKRIFGEMFTPESSKYLGSLVDLVKDDAESMGQLRKVALYRYKQAVTDKNGDVDLAKHNKFVQQYRQHLDMLFPEGQKRPWTKVGEIEQAVVAAEQKAKQLDKLHRGAWEEVFGPKYKYNSFTLVRRLADGRDDRAVVDGLIAHLEKTDPALLNVVREEAVNSMRLSLGAEKLPTFEALSKLAGNSRRARNFARIMGSDGDAYIRQVKMLSDAIKMTNTEGASLGTASANLLTSTTRAVAGPLSRIQRFITAGRQIYGWMNAKDAYAIISDPVRLQRALQYAASAPSARSVPAAIMADIGALGALFNKPEED